jgi:hypothetical protein
MRPYDYKPGYLHVWADEPGHIGVFRHVANAECNRAFDDFPEATSADAASRLAYLTSRVFELIEREYRRTLEGDPAAVAALADARAGVSQANDAGDYFGVQEGIGRFLYVVSKAASCQEASEPATARFPRWQRR